MEEASWQKRGKCGMLFIDLSKAFDSLQYDLILAKLNGYGFSYKSIKFISSLLSEIRLRTKINSEYNYWEDLIICVPQGSVLLFCYSTLVCATFFITESNITNYPDGSSPYECDTNLTEAQAKNRKCHSSNGFD